MPRIPAFQLSVFVAAAAAVLASTFMAISLMPKDDPPQLKSSQQAFETSAHIAELISAQLKSAASLQTLVIKEVLQERVDLTHYEGLATYLLRHKAAFDTVDYLYFATPQGGITTVGISPEGVLQIMKTDQNTPGEFISYRVSPEGKPSDVLKRSRFFDPRQREWFQCASNRYSGCWSEPYAGKLDRILGISFAAPIHNQQGVLLGVIGLDLILSKISRKMAEDNNKTGQISWVIDAKGKMIASTNGIDEVISKTGDDDRASITTIKQGVGSAVAELLTSKNISLPDILRPQQHPFRYRDGDFLLTLQPFRPNLDISWLIITAIPI